MIELDGTENKSSWRKRDFGVSLATAKAAADYSDSPLIAMWRNTGTHTSCADDEYYQLENMPTIPSIFRSL